MRFLLVTSTFLPGIGGAEVAIHHLAEGLGALGHSVAVCVIQRRTGAEHERSYELFRVTPPRGLGRTPLYEPWIARRLRALIDAWRPDLIHAHFAWPAGRTVLRARGGRRVPVVLTAHGEDIQVRPDVGYGYRLRRGLDRKITGAVRGADLLTAVGLAVRDEYLRLGAEAERVIPIPNGIAWELLAARRGESRRELGLPSDRTIVLAVGRNHPKKGFAGLIRALAELAPRHPEVMGLLVGRDVDRLRPLAAELGIVDRVIFRPPARPAAIRFHGEADDPARRIESYFHAADLYAMSSLVESAGIVTLEAMAAGLPVLARRAPGSEDLVQDGFNGLLVGVEPAAMVDGLARLLADPAGRRRLGETGREFARSFDRVRVAGRYVEAYERAARRKASGG